MMADFVANISRTGDYVITRDRRQCECKRRWLCRASWRYAMRVKRTLAPRETCVTTSATLDAHLDCAGMLFAFLGFFQGCS
jgi:hypothetical protein